MAAQRLLVLTTTFLPEHNEGENPWHQHGMQLNALTSMADRCPAVSLSSVAAAAPLAALHLEQSTVVQQWLQTDVLIIVNSRL